MKINLEEMTIGEMVIFEEVAGMSIGAIEKNKDSMKVIRALIFVQLRREKPDATLEDVDAMSMSEITDDDEAEEVEPDPTGPDA